MGETTVWAHISGSDYMLGEAYRDSNGDFGKYFQDDKSKIRLNLALDGCTFSMLSLARKLFADHPNTDKIAMELAFRWLLKAVYAGNKAALALLIAQRGQCPPILADRVERIITYSTVGDLKAVDFDSVDSMDAYCQRIASKFKRVYTGADEKSVISEVRNLVSGHMPKCDMIFAECFETVFGDLVALALTVMLAALAGVQYLSAFDHLLSSRLASIIDALFAFLCTLLLIVSMRTYSMLFACQAYTKVMAFDAEFRKQPLRFRLRILWTRLKLHGLSLLCVSSLLVLSMLGFNRVSLSVFSCTTYLITLIDTVNHLHRWIISSQLPNKTVGRYSLILKLVSIACASCIFSFTKSEWQDTIITLSMSLVAFSLIFLLRNCSIFTFAFLTCKYSPVLQLLSILKTLTFVCHRQITYRLPKMIKSLLVLVMFLHLVHKMAPGLQLSSDSDDNSSGITTMQEIYDVCRSTSSLAETVNCSRLEGRRINATTYISSIRLISRLNLQELLGLQTWSLYDDGLVQLAVDSFEKFKVEVKLANGYFSAQAVIDDDAIEMMRQLRVNDYITVEGVIETASEGPELRLIVHAIEFNGQYFEVKCLGTAIRHYILHVQDVLTEWRERLNGFTSPRTSLVSERYDEL